MSNFKPLPVDKAGPGPKADSIFYRSQDVLTNQYKNERVKQQQRQKELVKNIKTNHNGARINKLKPVTRIALGGNRNRNRNNNKNRNINTNKVDTRSQSQLIKNYKKAYSRSQYANTDNSKLPKGTMECVLRKEATGFSRAFVGHFAGSKPPKFKKCKIFANREPDLQTQIEKIQYDSKLPAKRRDELIAKLKFGLEDENESANRGKNYGGREWWFEFYEAPQPIEHNDNDNNNNNKEKDEQKPERLFLGKPKQDDRNYSYAILRWDGEATRVANVFPASFIEFGLSTQLVADGQSSAESAEKNHRLFLQKWRKKQAQKSVMEKLGKLFGHDENGNNIVANSKKLKGNETSDRFKEALKSDYLNKKNLDKEELQILREILNENGEFEEFMKEHNELHENDGSLQTGDTQNKCSIETKKLSARIKKNKTRGQLEELPDYDEFISDDEDEANLNNFDALDDAESDHLDDLDDDESENDELFKKLEKNLGEDVENKDYELPENAKDKKFDNDSDIENDEDTWKISDDEDDDEDDDDDGVIIRKKKDNDKNKNKNKNNKKRKLDSKDMKAPNAKRRRLNEADNKETMQELTGIVTRILKKHSKNQGIQMIEMWNKITAVCNTEQSVLRKMLPEILKNIGSRKTDAKGIKRWSLKNK